MIEKITTLSQTSYHQYKFRKNLLPDTDAAGPISASILGEMANPLKYLTSEEKHQTDDMAYGSMVDLLWLTPELWDTYCILQPDNAPKKPTQPQINAVKKSDKAIESINWWNDFARKSLGKIVVSKEIFIKVKEAVKMLNLHPLSKHIWNVSEKQTILMGKSNKLHPNGKYYLAKAMLDLLPQEGTIEIGGMSYNLNEFVVDLKQCHNVTEFGMKNAIKTFQYNMKTAWYLNMLQASGETQRDKAILIFQNSSAPFDVHVRIIDNDDINDGKDQYIERITKMNSIDPSNLTGLFDNEVKVISLPKWAKED